MEDTRECREGSEQANWVPEGAGGLGARTQMAEFAPHGDWASLLSAPAQRGDSINRNRQVVEKRGTSGVKVCSIPHSLKRRKGSYVWRRGPTSA